MMIKIPTFLSLSNEDHLIQQVVLAIGAGIYEEFVFRVLLISGLAILFGLIFNWGEFGKTFLSVIISSAIFSIFHFLDLMVIRLVFHFFLYVSLLEFF